MSVENAVRKRALLFEEVGKAALNVKYPNEFELYVIALELINAKGDTLRYFVFPVMPSNIDETKPQLTNIKKTLGGVSVLSTPGFIPTDITITGNFGRKLRILLGTDYQEFLNSFQDYGKVTKESFSKGVQDVFEDRIKSGYGCCKILEEIIEECNTIDETDGIRSLIFHNLALGNSYLVKPTTLRFFQSQESNMIWNYNLTLKSIAPLDSLYSEDQLEEMRKRLTITGYIQKQVDRVVNGLTSVLARAQERYT